MGEVCTKAQLIDFVKGSLVHSIPTLLTRSSAAQVSRAILQEGEHNRGQFTLSFFRRKVSFSCEECGGSLVRSVHQITKENEGTCVITEKEGRRPARVETG